MVSRYGEGCCQVFSKVCTEGLYGEVVVTVVVYVEDQAVTEVALKAYSGYIAVVDLEGGVGVCG